ncbi:unnamed protein product [Rhizoctonia solani]|uniref:DUF6533 domain-containing protein n=1 Tax=Rhizoctonia solani TaxID=456999 RepID=A0A8H3B5U9_9AGAM|nr:unnamed protein product [Rhizoctonia solani]
MASELETAVHDAFLGHCVSVAALALLFYDHLITFADEVRLVWPAKFGLVKAIFFINRYPGSIWISIAYAILDLQPFLLLRCRGWIIADTYVEVTNIQLLNFIITTRVYDIWQSRQLAFLVLAPLWAIHFIVDYVVITLNAIHTYTQYGYSPNSNMCTADPRGLWIVWLNGIIYHSIILILLIWLWLSTPRTEQTPLVRLVLRDGFIYFITILSMMMFNLIIWRYARPSLVLLPYHVVWVFLNGSLSRILLSLGSVQTSEEWGQRAKLKLVPKEIELGNVLNGVTLPTYTIKDERGEVIKSRTIEVII